MRCGRAAALALVFSLWIPDTALGDGARVPASQLEGAWTFSWAIAGASGLGLVLFAQAVLRLRRRGRPELAGAGRIALFCAGLAVLDLALLSPLDTIGEQYLLSGHMLQHMLIGDAAPALLIAGVRGPLTVFLLPPALLRRLARAAPVRAAFSFFLQPRVSFGAWAAVFACWHVPSLYDSVLGHRAIHDLEHLSFIFAGLLVWTQLVDPTRSGRLSRYRRVGFAVLLFAAGQVLADILIFSFHALYPAYAAQPERLFGLSPLLDQQLAGVVMMLEQLIALGTCSALLLWPVLRQRDRLEPSLAGDSG